MNYASKRSEKKDGNETARGRGKETMMKENLMALSTRVLPKMVTAREERGGETQRSKSKELSREGFKKKKTKIGSIAIKLRR